MFCIYCGKEIPEESRFCIYCGKEMPVRIHASYEEAEEAIRASIDRKMPVAMLMLKHRDRRFNFFEWHWFIVNGYDEGTAEPGASGAGEPGAAETGEPGSRFMIKAATYGKAHWLPLKEFWDTGHKEKGGLVLFRETEQKQQT